MKMFTAKEEKNLVKLLTKTDPESGLSLDEVHGLLFGLAITPEIVSAEEWRMVDGGWILSLIHI